MFAGTPVAAVNVTLCVTDPNENVTAVPVETVSDDGLKASDASASTVFAGGVPFGPVEYGVLPPQAAAPAISAALRIVR